MAKTKKTGRPYRVSQELAELAEARARAIRKRTGDHCAWTDVIRWELERGLKPKGK